MHAKKTVLAATTLLILIKNITVGPYAPATRLWCYRPAIRWSMRCWQGRWWCVTAYQHCKNACCTARQALPPSVRHLAVETLHLPSENPGKQQTLLNCMPLRFY